jgi:uncharacterized protein
MTHFIYLHGLNSAYDPNSEKLKALEVLGPVEGITYNSFGTYAEILEFLTDKIKYDEDLVLVGTSLGGFWASEIGRYLKLPSVIINPCHDPAVMLAHHVDIEQINYQTGEKGILTQAALNSYAHRLPAPDWFYLPLVLLDMGDDIIDAKITSEVFEGCSMIKFDGGSHRFDHMVESIPFILSYINWCSIVD